GAAADSVGRGPHLEVAGPQLEGGHLHLAQHPVGHRGGAEPFGAGHDPLELRLRPGRRLRGAARALVGALEHALAHLGEMLPHAVCAVGPARKAMVSWKSWWW